jgi:hypothetical protein
MARSSILPFRELLVEAFKELDVPTPKDLLHVEEARSDPREETRPDRKRPKLRDHTVHDVELPWALRKDAVPVELDLDDELPTGEPTRPVDLKHIAATLKATPLSLPVAIGAHTGVYRFTLNATDTLEPLEPVASDTVVLEHQKRAPLPVPEVLTPTPVRAKRAASAPRPTPSSTSTTARRSTRATSGPARAVADSSSLSASPSFDAPTPRSSRGPRPPSNRERANALYLLALDALSERRVDDARTLCGQAVSLAPKDAQYRALFLDLTNATTPSKKTRPKR